MGLSLAETRTRVKPVAGERSKGSRGKRSRRSRNPSRDGRKRETPSTSALDKTSTVERAISEVRSGDVVMIGGFRDVGSPASLIAEIIVQRIGNLMVIANDIPSLDAGVGRIVSAGLTGQIVTSHIGPGLAMQRKIGAGELRVETLPQGTLAERTRCGGAGLGGFLTPTGLGTAMADGKRIVEVDGQRFLLETPLTADVALIAAFRGDRWGNLTYRGTARNLNPVMAAAATRLVIAEVEELYEIGDLDPNEIETPGVYVDMVVEAK